MAVNLQTISAAVSGILKQKPATELDNDKDASPKRTLELSERQRKLDIRYRFYRCAQYDGWKFDWQGHEQLGPVEHDTVVSSGEIPGGFTDAGMAMRDDLPPAKFRAPSTPYHLTKVVVLRFSGLLFGEKHYPSFQIDDPRTQDWVEGVVKQSGYWKQWYKARNLGGAVGAVAVGFKFVDGQLVIEAHDARWASPVFLDRQSKELKRLEILYQYSEDVREDDGKWGKRWFWYRRVIDQNSDRSWPRVPVRSDEPDWDKIAFTEITHGYGECPVVWVQNVDVDEDVDGDSDCHGAYELIQDVNILYSTASSAVKANCEPTIKVKSAAQFDEIKLGNGNALQVEPGGDIDYMEHKGAGSDKAIALAEKLAELALNVVRCVLDRNVGGPSRTVTEIEHNYSSMIEQCDTLRTSYGDRGALRLMQKILRAARYLAKPIAVQDEDNPGVTRLVVRTIAVPPRKVVDEKTGAISWVKRQLGDFSNVELAWPAYFTPSQDEVLRKVQTSQAMITSGAGSIKWALEYLQKELDIKDIPAFIEQIKKERADGLLPAVAGTSGGGVGFQSMDALANPAPDGGAAASEQEQAAPVF